LKLHKSLSSISVFNYWKLQITGDLRYLIKDIDFSDLPEIEITQVFYDAQLSIFKEIEKIDNEIQYLFIDTLKYTIDYITEKTSSNEQKCNNSIHKYLKYLNNNFQSFTYLENKYNDVYDIYKLIKETSKNFTVERVQLLDYHLLNCESLNKWDLDDELVYFKDNFGWDIDENKTSMRKFMSFRDRAKLKIEHQKNK